MQQFGTHVAPRGVKITKLLLHETGSYNRQYRRPYETQMEASTVGNVLGKLAGASKYAPELMGGLANKFISPTATPEKELTITNGWDSRRMRFMMEIEYYPTVGGKLVEVVLGYTNHPGVSIQGSIDPRMEFYVNSIMVVRNTVGYGMMGTNAVSVVSSSHVLVNNDWGGIYDPVRDQHLRPTDVYTAMSRLQMRDIPQGDIIDARSAANNTAVKSYRSNASAAEYMSKIFNGYSQAVVSLNYGEGEKHILDKARGISSEDMAGDDPFLCAVMQIRGDPFVGNKFTFNDLRGIDPNVDNVTVAQLLSPNTMQTAHQAGQTSEWKGSDGITKAAAILSQSIPGLLMDLAMTRIIFKSSNREMNCAIRTAIMDAQSFSNGDLSKQLAQFMIRIENEVLLDISYNGAIDFALEMNVDLLGETWIRLSMDGQPFVDFVTPSFCDALLTPVVSNNNDRILNLAADFQILSEHLVDNHALTRGARKQTDFTANNGYVSGLI